MRLGRLGKSAAADVIPKGSLMNLRVDEVKPSTSNPRHLFDPEPLRELKESIRHHGVLVPITVFQLKGQDKYAILDGERRYRCCRELLDEGQELLIPANVVDPPDQLAGLLYMFSIHNFREAWELMPTALGLQEVMDATNETDTGRLRQLTGLSDAQIERCKKLLLFPKRFQTLSLDTNPSTRIAPNFWIELYPVLDLCEKELPDLVADMGRDGITDRFVDKYRAGSIRSVIHFRAIMEAYENSEAREEAVRRLRELILDEHMDVKATFDDLVEENRKVQAAVDTCSKFVRQIERLKLSYMVERKEVTEALRSVRDFADRLLQQLEGEDAPVVEENAEDE